MHRKQWIFDMDGTLTDSMTVVWQGAPLELLRRYGRTARPGIHDILLSMGMVEGAEYLIRTYDLPLTLRDYEPAMRQVIRDLYKKVELKPGVREMLARLKAEGVRMCICSNTWAEQCEEVLTRLGVADYFEFFYTAQGAKSKAHPEVFHEVLEGLGGRRLEHTLANLCTGLGLEQRGVRATLLDERSRITFVMPGETRRYPRNEYFYLSVFPMEGRAEGVSERGSFYELTDAVLTAGYPLGVSNEYADGSDCITISTQKGALVVVETVPDGPILS